MKKVTFLSLALLLCAFITISCARETAKKVILLISEQNIGGPQRAWWASEIDLSVSETKIAQSLIGQGFSILEPSDINKIVQKDKAFKIVDISEGDSVRLGKLAKADYVILGKAVVSSSGNIPQSKMRSIFANISAKVIRSKDGKVISYSDASGSSAHMDVITGGKEALNKAAESLAVKIIDAINKDGGN